MKWTNKGHEFDDLGKRLITLKSIYLFGAGVHGKTIYEKYRNKIDIKGFIDNDAIKQDNGFCGLPVFSPNGINLLENEVIVISAQPSSINNITGQLNSLGYTDNVFPIQLFFPIFDSYKYGEVCLSSISFLPTTVCNLNCKHCLNFTPYIKNHQIRPIEQLKQDLDLLFSKIDTLLLLHISGGEPLTYSHLYELVDHIVRSYKEKLGRLEMTTNGTIIPSDIMLKLFKDANLFLTVDDYRDALPQYRDKQMELINKLNSHSVNYQILKADSWIDLAPPDMDITGLSAEQLVEYFNACAVPWQEYRNGKLWLCNYAAYADIAGKYATLQNEYFDIAKLNKKNHRELIEFRRGYSDKGYTEFCRQCAGYSNNTRIVPVAKQL